MAWLGLLLATAASGGEEFRGLWVDAWGAGIKTPAEVTQLVDDARDGHFNAIVVQVRRRGDAFYNDSPYEPKTADPNVSPSDFDSLADLIAKAHNTGAGPRLEVYAWIVTYPLWGSTNAAPPQPNHPFNLHPDWLSRNSAGASWDGSNYNLDPGHPEVQQHLFNVAMDILSRYDVDGFNWDYIRYPANIWGYNPVSVERFQRLHGRSDTPASSDPDWLQFRRDQVTALVRKVYLSAIALKPQVKISADTITCSPGVTTDMAWTNGARAYLDVLQDWRGWMEEGILDLNLPMAYFDQGGAHRSAWEAWNIFAKEHRYSRHVAIGPALHLNSLSNGIFQIRHALAPTTHGDRADGVCGYSYRVTNDEGLPRSVFLEALTGPGGFDSVFPPVFAQTASVPAMPWKTNPNRGHLRGFVFLAGSASPVDGARVTLSSPQRFLASDATGFYGAVDLTPGLYTVSATAPGAGRRNATMTILAGQVASLDFFLPVVDDSPPEIFDVGVAVTDRSANINWATDESADSAVDYGFTPGYGTTVTAPLFAVAHLVTLSGLQSESVYHFRVRSRDLSGNEAVSGDFTFRTNPQGAIDDLIIDNGEASLAGAWSTGSSAMDKYLVDYRYKSQGNGSAYVEFRPTILAAGFYDVRAWYPQGNNRPTDAPYLITFQGGTDLAVVNQQTNGGRWNLLGRYLFAAGSGGHVRVTDAFTESGKVVMADAVRFGYAAPPPIPPTILEQPQSATVLAGQEVVLRVSATGSPPLYYQWRCNGLAIPGATQSSLTRALVQVADAGEYAVVVTNSAGQAVSGFATLVVLSRPIEFGAIALLPGDQVRLSVQVDPGHTYSLESSADGREWHWLTDFSAPDGRFEYVDGPVSAHRQRIYRARSAPSHLTPPFSLCHILRAGVGQLPAEPALFEPAAGEPGVGLDEIVDAAPASFQSVCYAPFGSRVKIAETRREKRVAKDAQVLLDTSHHENDSLSHASLLGSPMRQRTPARRRVV